MVRFAKYNDGGNLKGQLKQGLKLGKCFLLSDNNIAEIRGKFDSDQLTVTFKMWITNNLEIEVLKSGYMYPHVDSKKL